MMQMLERERCVVSGRADLEEFFTIKDFSIFCGATDRPSSEDMTVNLVYSISKGSGMVQIMKRRYLHSFFGETGCELPEGYHIDAIVHSHVAEHMYEPLVFLKLVQICWRMDR